VLVDALSNRDARKGLHVELGPAGGEVFDKDSVAVITEGVIELLALRGGDQFARNLHHDLGVAFVCGTAISHATRKRQKSGA
jgi:hypothetical protein